MNHTMIGTTFSVGNKTFTYTYLGKNEINHSGNEHLFLVKHATHSYINEHSDTWPDIQLNCGYLIPKSNVIKKQIHDKFMSVINSKRDLIKLKKIHATIHFQNDIYMVLRAFLGDTDLIGKNI